MTRSQAAELAKVRVARESLGTDLTKLVAQFDAQQQLLADYHIRLGVAGSAGWKRQILRQKDAVP